MYDTLGQLCVETLAEGDHSEDLVRLEDIIKMDLKESWCNGCDGVQWIHWAEQC
jgi:hypothetical protein